MSTKSMEMEAQLIEKIVDKRNAIMTKAEEKARKIIESAEEEVKRSRPNQRSR